MIGAVGAIAMLLASKLLDFFRIDDVVGAVPVHLVAGIVGTLAVVVSNPEADIITQLIGIGTVGIFVASISLLLWFVFKVAVGIRLHWSHEELGSDMAELGVRAYNLEFGENNFQREPVKKRPKTVSKARAKSKAKA